MSIPKFARTPQGFIGLAMLALIVLLAFVGPLVAPHSLAQTIGVPSSGPNAGAILGTDELGRDVFSRLLDGGRSVLILGAISTTLSYLVGLAVGVTAGYTRSWIDPVLMRSVDVLLAFPALLVLLLLVSSMGSSIPVLMLGVVLIQLPGIARVMRTATQEVSVRGYVEAAMGRGESTLSILVREVLPNIRHVLLADFGLRFGYSILLIASVNYLGFGLQPPSPDWGVSISINQSIISLNPWAVLAPAIPLAILTVAVNLVADAYSTASGRRLAA